jgi:hypothetical protein
MTVLNFMLSPEAVGKVNSALVCLGRFSESVSIESTKDYVRLRSSKWSWLTKIVLSVGAFCLELYQVCICFVHF